MGRHARKSRCLRADGSITTRCELPAPEQFVDPTEFRKRVEAASLVISHAGMGSIITALELGKRIIVMPRRASLGEHRNDHQLATAKRFAEQGRIMVAFTEQELVDRLDQLQVYEETDRLSAQASPRLISTIRTFIETGRICFENGDVSPSAEMGNVGVQQKRRYRPQTRGFMIPIAKPFLDETEADAAREAVLSGWISQGPQVAAFEREFAALVGAPHACAVSNCTMALHLALLAQGVRPGDEVITASHSFIASANNIRYCGATPVFVDIDPATYNLDPECVADAITERTRAILAVHQMGMPLRYDLARRIGKPPRHFRDRRRRLRDRQPD